MYIEKYWGSYIGGTDDSLTLLDYLIDKQKTEVTFSEIFIDTGLKKLNGDFRTSPNLKYINTEGIEYNFYYAIDLIADLAALMLECAINGCVSLGRLLYNKIENTIRITFTEEDKTVINKALSDFIQDPLVYDLKEIVPDEDLREMAKECEMLRKELLFI